MLRFSDIFRGPRSSRASTRSSRKASNFTSHVTGSAGNDEDDADEVPRQRRTIMELIRIIFRINPTNVGNNKSIIDKETLMFGKCLDEHVDEESGVSYFVFWCIAEIENTGDGINTNALYRASGSKKQVDRIVQTEKEKMTGALESEKNVHVLTGALKTFLMQLRKPLLSAENFLFQYQNESEVKATKIINYKRALNRSLNHEEKCTLEYILRHLLRVVENNFCNNINFETIATVVGPTIVRSAESSISDVRLQIEVVRFILENYHELFDTANHRLNPTTATMPFNKKSFDVKTDPSKGQPADNDDYSPGSGRFHSLRDDYSASSPTPPRKVSSESAQGSVFGGYLRDAVDEETGASKFVVWCVRAVETTGENIKTDALYRASGNQAKVQEIVSTDCKHLEQRLKNETNVNVLTGALKLFFRQLKEPLMDHQMFETILSIDDKTNACRKAKIIIEGLQDVERATFKFLMRHLKTVLEHRETNKMNIESLGVVFGPTLMRVPEDSEDLADVIKQQNRVIAFLFTNYDDIFTN